MPSLPYLAVRYLAWLIGLRILFGVLVQVAGFPNLQATGVILAAAPMADIGMQAHRRSTRPLSFREWSGIWALCLSLFVTAQVILPAMVLAPFRAAFSNPQALLEIATLVAATAAMMALFLFIGRRTAGGRRRG